MIRLQRLTGWRILRNRWPTEESDLITKNKDSVLWKGPVQFRDAKEGWVVTCHRGFVYGILDLLCVVENNSYVCNKAHFL